MGSWHVSDSHIMNHTDTFDWRKGVVLLDDSVHGGFRVTGNVFFK